MLAANRLEVNITFYSEVYRVHLFQGWFKPLVITSIDYTMNVDAFLDLRSPPAYNSYDVIIAERNDNNKILK